MSVFPVYIGLDELVKRSQAIIIAKRLPKAQFQVIEIMKSSYPELKKDMKIDVKGADDDLFADIGEAQKRGESVPLPNLPFYKSVGDISEKQTNLIIFLSKDRKGDFRFSVQDSIEHVSEKARIKKLIE